MLDSLLVEAGVSHHQPCHVGQGCRRNGRVQGSDWVTPRPAACARATSACSRDLGTWFSQTTTCSPASAPTTVTASPRVADQGSQEGGAALAVPAADAPDVPLVGAALDAGRPGPPAPGPAYAGPSAASPRRRPRTAPPGRRDSRGAGSARASWRPSPDRCPSGPSIACRGRDRGDVEAVLAVIVVLDDIGAGALRPGQKRRADAPPTGRCRAGTGATA